MPAIFILILVSFLVFLRVYGPGLITALLQTWAEEEKRGREEQRLREDAASVREIVSLNEQLSRAFGSSDDSRKCEESLRYLQSLRTAAKLWMAGEVDEDATTELYIDIAWCDDEIDLVLADETLTARTKCSRIVSIIDRG